MSIAALVDLLGVEPSLPVCKTRVQAADRSRITFHVSTSPGRRQCVTVTAQKFDILGSFVSLFLQDT